MKKKIILRSILGFPLGLALGHLITIFISCFLATGTYYPCVPELAERMGSEIHAVLLQAFFSGIIGSGFAAASVIWEMEDWGLVKQTGIYFLLISVIMMPIAYAAYWMEHSLKGILSYFGIFLAIFVVIWLVQYLIARHNVKKLNETLSQHRHDDAE